MNKVANLVKFYNRKASDIIKDVYQGYNHYPFSFREMLKKHGNEIITSIVIVRSPLSNILHQILNSLTLGHLENRLNEYDYNSLFHLKVIINNKYSIEKESTIKFTQSNHISAHSETREVKHIPYNLTISKMCENCFNQIGDSMFSYNSKHNNCQAFIKNLLEASGMHGNEIFIMQDVKQIFHGLTGTRQIINTVTDIGNRLNMLSEGAGLSKHKQKLTTLSNSELMSIALKIKLKLNGIYMKDELKTPLKQGCYIINLQNHDEPGSHWTCFIKDKDCIYYHDSFGAVPPQNEYDIFSHEMDNIYTNTSDHQNIDSSSCGWWCIAFLYYMTNSKGNMLDRMKKFNKKFITDTKRNELILKKYIDRIYLNNKMVID